MLEGVIRIERGSLIYHKDSPPWPLPHLWAGWGEGIATKGVGKLICKSYTKWGCLRRAKMTGFEVRIELRTNDKIRAKLIKYELATWAWHLVRTKVINLLVAKANCILTRWG